MPAQYIGVHQSDQGDWVWKCACGGEGSNADRETAREEYKQHRRTCGKSSQPEVQSTMPTTTAKKRAPAAKRGTKKAAVGKPRKVLLSATDPRLPAVVERMRKGSSLIIEARKLGFTHNGPLRAALPKFLGGKKQYEALMALVQKNAPVKTKKTPAAKKPAVKKKPVVRKARPRTVASRGPAVTLPPVSDIRNVPSSNTPEPAGVGA